MPLTTIPLALDIAAIVMFCTGDFSPGLKAVLSAAIVLKFCIYFFLVLASDSEKVKLAGVIVCGVFNAAGVIFSVSSGMWPAAIPLVTVLVLTVAWNTGAFDLLRRGRD